MIKKKLGITLLTVVTLLSTATPLIASASSISSDNQTLKTSAEQGSTVYMNNETFLNNLKTQNLAGYNKIPDSVKAEAIHADLLRQGTTKIVRTSNGFKIYLNSAIVKTIKYTGIGAAAVLGVLGAAGITATTAGIGSAAFVGVGAVIGYIANEVNASRGIVVTFSKKGSLVSWTQQ